MTVSAMKVLAQGYFNQDYDLKHADPVDVIKDFAATSPIEDVREVVEIATQLLRYSTEQNMRDLWWSELRSGFDPSQHGMTYRQWFEQVLDVLRERS